MLYGHPYKSCLVKCSLSTSDNLRKLLVKVKIEVIRFIVKNRDSATNGKRKGL